MPSSRSTVSWALLGTPLRDLEADSIVRAIECLHMRSLSVCQKYRITSIDKALNNIAKADRHHARAQRWLGFLSAYTQNLGIRSRVGPAETSISFASFSSQLPALIALDPTTSLLASTPSASA